MSKSEIDKIKAVLAEINTVTRGLENDFLIKTLTKALEIAVDQLQAMSFLDKECRSPEQKTLKQISEILEDK